MLDFIHKLAAYEKLSHEVQATVGDIEDALFGARPFAEAAIVQFDAAPVGFILWFPNLLDLRLASPASTSRTCSFCRMRAGAA